MKASLLILLGLAVIIIGFLLVFAGILFGMLESAKTKETQVRGGGVILIGPIPIGFGTDTKSLAVVLGLAIILIVVTFMLFYRWAS